MFRAIKTILLATTLALTLTAPSLAACSGSARAGAVSVREALDRATFDTQVKVYGVVSGLRQSPGPYFTLSSGGRTMKVYYDGMMEDNDVVWEPVHVDGIRDGDEVVVTGQVKSAGIYRAQYSFFAQAIAVLKSSK